MTEPIPEDYYLKPIEPIDQATKDLIEKEAEHMADSFDKRGTGAHQGYRRGYIRGATVWADKLKQAEQDLAKAKFDNENAWKGVKQVCAEKYELEHQLAKERELRKELVDVLIDIKGDLEKEGYTTIPEQIQSLLKKAKE